jgi:peptidoglycan hydrolase-like protein with peptidoglycan-binding domain
MIEAHAERDLACPDVWAASLERSLARRRRPRRTSLELSSLLPPRDLTQEREFSESLRFAHARRRVADQLIAIPDPAARKLSIAGMIASVAGPGALALATWHEVTSGHSGGVGTAAASTPKTSKGGTSKSSGAQTVAAKPHSNYLADFEKQVKATSPVKPQAPKPQVLDGTVREVQRALGVQVDGVLGAKTISALKGFQSAHGLKVDAVVGQATWTALSARLPKVQHHDSTSSHRVTALAASAKSSSTRTHAKHGGVRALQNALGLSADGVFGPKTARAVKRYQRGHGLTSDGVVGPDTRRALGIGTGATLHQRHLHRATHHSASSQTSSGTSAPVGGIGAMIAAANQIATRPYVWGGGHGSFQSAGYDCSGSVSYVLHAAGLLSSPLDSTALESYGAPGPGKYVTIYANAGHAWMTINGRRFDTSAMWQSGSRWGGARSGAGFVVRHPPGY